MSENQHLIQTELDKKEQNFIAGGGEMGGRMRSYDWSTTSLGPLNEWPQSLRTTVNIILSSKIPMFLWWGDDLIQFYNDAYQSIFGNNVKSSAALGQRGDEFGLETWSSIKPLIDQVRSGGKATGSEDQLLPIYRNGKLEEINWTLNYSPVYDESGNVGGVLVVSTEATKKARDFKNIDKSLHSVLDIFSQAPVAVAIFKGSDFMIEYANQKVLEYWD